MILTMLLFGCGLWIVRWVHISGKKGLQRYSFHVSGVSMSVPGQDIVCVKTIGTGRALRVFLVLVQSEVALSQAWPLRGTRPANPYNQNVLIASLQTEMKTINVV